ncbi:tetratricopeptide repeat protein [Sphingomonas lenta]|uniref:Uncharacterized protein n=1 Tax=Sphingomonas lenta TaxID=1141887 RepID=A0A2A2SH10_9SPHN|nr:tetratricopeptide repeat protein [Sphingomonas lenta]PAX08460.1 hypothetical protein CKY28_03465 [Sphingomonas lenta]
MKNVSTAVLSALLLTGAAGGAIVAEPAAAQKKKEKVQQPKLSPDVLKPLQAAEAALKVNDLATAEPAIAQAEAAAKTDEDRYFAAASRISLEERKIQAQRAANPTGVIDQTRLAAPLDVLINSPRTDPKLKGQLAYNRGIISFNSKQYPQAVQYFTQAQQLGYTSPDLTLQIAQAKERAGDVQGALGSYEAEIQRATATGQKAPEEVYRYALARAMKQPGQALPWMQRLLAAYPTQKNWRDMLVLYGLQQGSIATLDTPQKIDLFRLMDDTNSLADQYDYGEFAQKLRDRGLPVEARKILQEGIAAGKIPAGNAEYKAMQSEIAKLISNEGPLGPLETKAKAAGDGKLAAQTGDAYLSQGNNAKAAELYRAALQKGGVNADEVNTRLGIALARQGDKAGAKAAFAAVQGAPRKDLAALWSLHVDTTA